MWRDSDLCGTSWHKSKDGYEKMTQPNDPEKSVRQQLEETTNVLLGLIPEGTPMGDALRTYIANMEFAQTMMVLAPPEGGAEAPLKAKDLEALRVAIKATRQANAVLAVYTKLTPPMTDTLPPVACDSAARSRAN